MEQAATHPVWMLLNGVLSGPFNRPDQLFCRTRADTHRPWIRRDTISLKQVSSSSRIRGGKPSTDVTNFSLRGYVWALQISRLSCARSYH